MTKNIAIVSLGCDKNRVDTEKMLYYLINKGHKITNDYNEAEIIIVNTCAFIQSARQEAVDSILSAAQYKENGVCEKLIVTGCLPQKYSKLIENDLAEVDAFLGTRDYEKITETIEKLYEPSRVILSEGNDYKDSINRTVSTPAHYAYLKIADGCDNKCTFCTIPSIRGGYISRSMDSLLDEAKILVNNGVKEIILVAQDVTRYGTDLYKEYKLVELIKRLSELDILWIRLLYCYPELVTDELLDEIDNNEKVAKYIDIPLQHYDDGILKLMNRRGKSSDIETLINKIRNRKNYIAVRTTFMAGFPSERESQFENLYRFLERAKIDHVGVFAYSAEEDTPSAKIKGRINKAIKKQRVQKLGELHLMHCIEKNREFIGKTVKVIYEDIDYQRKLFKGRTEYNAPDVDSFVYFKGSYADAGKVYDVKITGFDEYDLIGEIVE